jgi:iron(III) transport system ATP-binding protein
MGAVVRGGEAETPLGTFDASWLAEGTAAQVMIRPEGLAIAANGNGIPATVIFARMLGRSSHLRLAVPGIGEPLQVLAPGVFLPEDGAAVAIQVDRKQAFVFSDE